MRLESVLRENFGTTYFLFTAAYDQRGLRTLTCERVRCMHCERATRFFRYSRRAVNVDQPHVDHLTVSMSVQIDTLSDTTVIVAQHAANKVWNYRDKALSRSPFEELRMRGRSHRSSRTAHPGVCPAISPRRGLSNTSRRRRATVLVRCTSL